MQTGPIVKVGDGRGFYERYLDWRRLACDLELNYNVPVRLVTDAELAAEA